MTYPYYLDNHPHLYASDYQLNLQLEVNSIRTNRWWPGSERSWISGTCYWTSCYLHSSSFLCNHSVPIVCPNCRLIWGYYQDFHVCSYQKYVTSIEEWIKADDIGQVQSWGHFHSPCWYIITYYQIPSTCPSTGSTPCSYLFLTIQYKAPLSSPYPTTLTAWLTGALLAPHFFELYNPCCEER